MHSDTITYFTLFLAVTCFGNYHHQELTPLLLEFKAIKQSKMLTHIKTHRLKFIKFLKIFKKLQNVAYKIVTNKYYQHFTTLNRCEF
jgi:hypothetical protein